MDSEVDLAAASREALLAIIAGQEATIAQLQLRAINAEGQPMRLGDHGINRRNLRQGGGHGTGEDHVDGLFGIIELFVYQTPNTRPKGYLNLKSFLEAQGCEVAVSLDKPLELERYEAIRITLPSGDPLPNSVVKRAHKWAHQRNYLHSFFKPMYQ